MADLISDLLDRAYEKDLLEEIRLLEAAREISRERRKELRARVLQLTRQVGRLQLVTIALFELLEEHGPLDGDVLVRKIEEVDRRDGQQEERLAQPGEKTRCARCHRVLSKTFGRCLYCASS